MCDKHTCEQCDEKNLTMAKPKMFAFVHCSIHTNRCQYRVHCYFNQLNKNTYKKLLFNAENLKLKYYNTQTRCSGSHCSLIKTEITVCFDKKYIV